MANVWEYDYDILVKLLVVGDSAVGKSCMLLRYAEDQFNETHMTTIGVDFKLKTKKIDGKTAKIQIWDTAGQERFRTITASYYRGAHGIVLTYDITNEKSFDHVRDWLLEIRENASDDVAVILVGNKSDLENERMVEKSRGAEFARKNHLSAFLETSAKDGSNIESAFDKIIMKVIEKQNYLTQSPQTGSAARNVIKGPTFKDSQPQQSGGGCC